uniref:DUF1294 domain-containing protein n=1 Tax=Rhizobium leguminosarum TaxID=384 RepID=A0A154IAA7_RHILE|nr:hypothetical protein A4A59_04610 [Rhizobium leguminosarum]
MPKLSATKRIASSKKRHAIRSLLFLALIGGSLGAVAAQQLLRHKTRKEPFRSILAAILILHGALIAILAIVPQWSLHLPQDF